MYREIILIGMLFFAAPCFAENAEMQIQKLKNAYNAFECSQFMAKKDHKEATRLFEYGQTQATQYFKAYFSDADKIKKLFMTKPSREIIVSVPLYSKSPEIYTGRVFQDAVETANRFISLRETKIILQQLQPQPGSNGIRTPGTNIMRAPVTKRLRAQDPNRLRDNARTYRAERLFEAEEQLYDEHNCKNMK